MAGGGGMRGGGACVTGGVCMAGWLHGKGGMCSGESCMAGGACIVGGHVWQGVCVAEGGGGYVAGKTSTAADGTHPTEMHSYFTNFLLKTA